MFTIEDEHKHVRRHTHSSLAHSSFYQHPQKTALTFLKWFDVLTVIGSQVPRRDDIVVCVAAEVRGVYSKHVSSGSEVGPENT